MYNWEREDHSSYASLSKAGWCSVCPQSAWARFNGAEFLLLGALPLALGAVMLQDVRVFLPELLPYDVAVVLLHPPSAAGHRHVLLLPPLHLLRRTGKLGPFFDSFLPLRLRNRGHD